MTCGRTIARTIQMLVIILGLSLSACGPGPRGYVYEGYPSYYYPSYGVFDVGYGGWGVWRHGWDHGSWGHDWGHGGWGHGFAHGGFGGHGGGGHR